MVLTNASVGADPTVGVKPKCEFLFLFGPKDGEFIELDEDTQTYEALAAPTGKRNVGPLGLSAVPYMRRKLMKVTDHERGVEYEVEVFVVADAPPDETQARFMQLAVVEFAKAIGVQKQLSGPHVTESGLFVAGNEK